MGTIRVLDAAARPMQRLGYLKHLVRRVSAFGTSSLDNLGRDLIETVTKRVAVPVTADRATYVQRRLTDRAYDSLKKQLGSWREGDNKVVSMELQDLYLADPHLPSRSGKLVRDDWRRYPPLAVGLGLVRAGTYSANTRAMSLLHFTCTEELRGFSEYDGDVNPLRLTQPQALLLLYSFLENDGEVMCPLLAGLARLGADVFTDRDVGERLPEILRGVIGRHERRPLATEQRERLSVLSQVADSIDRWRGRAYTGTGANIHASRPRVEPYVDIGFLSKPDPFRYAYRLTPVGLVWAQALMGLADSDDVAVFLRERFFQTAALARSGPVISIGDRDSIVKQSYAAWQAIRSVGGYAPIEEIALVAGIQGLCQDGLILGSAQVREGLISYQRDYPYQVRFTVNRMGVLAHARFLKQPD